MMMHIEQSQKLYEKAKDLMPGGVNSPVRAFLSVGGTPRFIQRAKDQYLYDEDGNAYIDYIGSWGPMILGHNPDFVLDAVRKQLDSGMSYGAATALEVEMAELIHSIVPAVEMMRMVNSGTEAVMSAIRAARGFTGRDKIIKFAGCYHGHADALLVKAGSGVMTAGIPDSSGVPKGCTADTLTAVYNDLDSAEALFAQYPEEIACVIVEPVAANMGVVVPKKGFLEGLRALCDQYGALLILDEVITGFRLQIDGAIGHFGVVPDLVTYGKIIGGGIRRPEGYHADGISFRFCLPSRNAQRQSGCHARRSDSAALSESPSGGIPSDRIFVSSAPERTGGNPCAASCASGSQRHWISVLPLLYGAAGNGLHQRQDRGYRAVPALFPFHAGRGQLFRPQPV